MFLNCRVLESPRSPLLESSGIKDLEKFRILCLGFRLVVFRILGFGFRISGGVCAWIWQHPRTQNPKTLSYL